MTKLGRTVTVNTTAWHAICACCHDHGDRSLASEIVTCTTCGAMCSCEGCVAEATMPLDGQCRREPEVLREAADGSRRYRYMGYEFDVERTRFMWWCFHGYSIPGDMLAHCHEAGWGSFTHRAVLRKVTRAIRATVRDRLRDGALHDDQEDFRMVPEEAR